MDRTRVIATFDTAAEAEEAADRLEEADIDVDLEEATRIGGESLVAGGSPGVALRIAGEDEQQARELLGDEYADALAPVLDEETDDPFSDTDPGEEEEWEEITEGLHCPNCHSKDLGLGTPSFQLVVAGVVVTFLALFLVPDAYGNWALAAWGLMLTILVLGLGLRRFPLVCKECGHTGLRHKFDPTEDE